MSEQEIVNTPQTDATTDATTETPTEAPVELSLNDLMSLKLIIQVSVKRGCWMAEELEDVGRLYKRLSSFLDKVLPEKETSTNPPEAGAEVENKTQKEKIVI